MNVFADASALVKLYADEPGDQLVRRHTALVVSQLSRVEVPAALWRKTRRGELSTTDARTLVAAFEADYFGTPTEAGAFAVVPPTPAILDHAVRLVARHILRAHDSVQLATALTVGETLAEPVLLLAWDTQLRAAAEREGLDVEPPARS